MYLFHLRMTFLAGLSDILPVDGGTRIAVRKDQMRRVTGSACCSDRQSFFQETFTVDTLCIILNDMVL